MLLKSPRSDELPNIQTDFVIQGYKVLYFKIRGKRTRHMTKANANLPTLNEVLSHAVWQNLVSLVVWAGQQLLNPPIIHHAQFSSTCNIRSYGPCIFKFISITLPA